MNRQLDDGVEQDNPNYWEEDVRNPDDAFDTLKLFYLILLGHFQNLQQSRFYRAGTGIFYRAVKYVFQHNHSMTNAFVQFYVGYVQTYFQFRSLRHPALEHRAVRACRNGFKILLMAMVGLVLKFWHRGGFAMVDRYQNVVDDTARDVWLDICATELWKKLLDVVLVGTWVVTGVWGMLVVLGDFFLATGLLGWWG